MSTRTLTNTVNPDVIALNAAIFGYAGHSVLTPHGAIPQVWWTESYIADKVNQDFIKSKLRPEARANLSTAIGFGDGLTDDTYIEWILARAKRLFLILLECAVPEQIFGLVDDSWDDDDLPMTQEDVNRLAQKDIRLNKFYTAQFQFLLRPLSEGAHIDFEPAEIIPLDFVQRLPPATALQKWSRVHMPKAPERVYMQRKMSLDDQDGGERSREIFLADVETARSIQNEHIASIYATYTANNTAYFLSPFVAEHTLKTLIDFRTPASFQKVDKAQRATILLGWLYCLADALTTLHENAIWHTAISPSNILIDAKNRIAFSDIGSLNSFQTDKRIDPSEMYNYMAPEVYTANFGDDDDDYRTQLDTPVKSKSRFFHRRKRSDESKHTSSSSSSSINRVQPYGDNKSFSTSQTSISSQPSNLPLRPNTVKRMPSFMRASTATWHSSTSGSSSHSSALANTIPPPPPKLPSTMPPGITLATLSRPLPPLPKPTPDASKADIFSLGVVTLTLLTFALGPKPPTAPSKLARTLRHARAPPSAAHISAWLVALEHDAFEHDARAFRAFPPLLKVAAAMLDGRAARRPSARDVRDAVARALTAPGAVGIACAACAARALPGEGAPAPAVPFVKGARAARRGR